MYKDDSNDFRAVGYVVDHVDLWKVGHTCVEVVRTILINFADLLKSPVTMSILSLMQSMKSRPSMVCTLSGAFFAQ